MTIELLTAKQVAADYNLPSVRTLATLRAQGLPTVKLGRAFLFERDDVENFIKARKEQKCQDEIAVHTSNSSVHGASSIYSGAKKEVCANAALARQTAEKLKKSCRSS